MMAKRFQVSLPAELLSKEFLDPIIQRKRLVPVTVGDPYITFSWNQILEIKEISRSTEGPIYQLESFLRLLDCRNLRNNLKWTS